MTNPATPGGYEFGSDSVGRRSPSRVDDMYTPIVHVPSTLTTVVIPSRLSEDMLSPRETSYCGSLVDQGSFTQNFDDLRLQHPASTEHSNPMSLFTPYRRFYYSGGFTVISAPEAPFTPSSGNLMLQFTPSSISNASKSVLHPDTADISVGPQKLSNCFSFNFTKVSLGCDSRVVACSFTVAGFAYDRVKLQTVEVTSHTFSVPACKRMEKCTLATINVSGFDNLTSITIKEEVNGKPTIWWADDFTFSWFDNTCESGICRSKVPVSISGSSWVVTGRQAASRLMGLLRVRG